MSRYEWLGKGRSFCGTARWSVRFSDTDGTVGSLHWYPLVPFVFGSLCESESYTSYLQRPVSIGIQQRVQSLTSAVVNKSTEPSPLAACLFIFIPSYGGLHSGKA
jgi:hypothetical protein